MEQIKRGSALFYECFMHCSNRKMLQMEACWKTNYSYRIVILSSTSDSFVLTWWCLCTSGVSRELFTHPLIHAHHTNTSVALCVFAEQDWTCLNSDKD